jgi:hypothetical protein
MSFMAMYEHDPKQYDGNAHYRLGKITRMEAVAVSEAGSK